MVNLSLFSLDVWGSRYPKRMRKHSVNIPPKCADTPSKCAGIKLIPHKNAQIPQRNAQMVAVTIYNPIAYVLFIESEIIYIILSNKLSNYRNTETAAQNFWDFGGCFLAAVSDVMKRLSLISTLKKSLK